MSGWEMKIITAEARRLMALATEDADLRAELRVLAEAILAATEVPRPHDATTPPPPADVAPASSPTGAIPTPVAGGDEPDCPTTQGVVQAGREQGAESLRELTLGRSRPAPVEVPAPLEATPHPGVSDADLSRIEVRCRLKAEGARWAVACQRRLREGTDIQFETAPEDREIVAWADRLMDGFFWRTASEPSQPADISLIDDVAGCFEAVAEALSLVLHDCGRHRGAFERALPLIAEAQSALRAAIHGIQGPDDPDQLQVFEWLKVTAARHHVYIKRFMRADDLADPTHWPDLLARIEGVNAKHRPTRRRSQQQGAWDRPGPLPPETDP